MSKRFFDLTKPENRAPKREVNGNRAPEEIARHAIDNSIDVHKTIAEHERRRMYGVPPQPKSEQSKPIVTEHALRLARMLLDPRYGRRR